MQKNRAVINYHYRAFYSLYRIQIENHYKFITCPICKHILDKADILIILTATLSKSIILQLLPPNNSKKDLKDVSQRILNFHFQMIKQVLKINNYI
ncbi:unnamed protein product [Paramecium octaurelia]|uniref:Uncharacterized protein n=1 Tax=Paramecium octaurelia TaxID=43137 RepID=A0A8S1T6V4_PAROT|nr:unnamed protein product [Paramecium octaurelia]